MKAWVTSTQANNELINVCLIGALNQFLEDDLLVLMLYLASTKFSETSELTVNIPCSALSSILNDRYSRKLESCALWPNASGESKTCCEWNYRTEKNYCHSCLPLNSLKDRDRIIAVSHPRPNDPRRRASLAHKYIRWVAILPSTVFIHLMRRAFVFLSNETDYHIDWNWNK